MGRPWKIAEKKVLARHYNLPCTLHLKSTKESPQPVASWFWEWHTVLQLVCGVRGVFMKFAEVAENVKWLVDELPSQETFIYELLLAYGSPKSGVTLLKKGTRNLSKIPGEVLWKNKVWFQKVAQVSRLPGPVPQTARLPDPDTTRGSERECRRATGRSPTSPNARRPPHRPP